MIDYGAGAADLYGPRRRGGTLMTYRGHRADGASDAPYRDVGDRDLTAHVDFSALATALEGASLAVDGRTTQASFLVACGLGDLLERERACVTSMESWLTTRSAIMRLLDPRHLGAFGVLLASRGMPAGSTRRGLGAGREDGPVVRQGGESGTSGG